MVFGTFDNFHPGHQSYLSQARIFGEEIIAIVARDKNVLAIKGRPAQEDEKTRVKKVRAALRGMDRHHRAVLGNLKNRWLVLRKYRPDIICLGYDQKIDQLQLKREIVRFRLFCKVKRLKPYYPDKYKSSHCRK